MSKRKRSRERKLCPVCRKRPVPKRTGKQGGNTRKTVCHCCAQRQWRRDNPISAAFARLKDSARERGIVFALERVQFECFCKLSRYVERKGNGADCLTVDRIDNLKGYVPGNIQPLTRSKNSEKRAKYDAARIGAGMAWRRDYPEPPDEELPDRET